MIEYLILMLAIPLGLILAKITEDEKPIYQKAIYFPTIMIILTVLTLIFAFQNQQIALTTTFLLITTYTWNSSQ